MIEIGKRSRSQPPPPRVLYESLTEPNRDPARPWLDLLEDEMAPSVRPLIEGRTVEWSSIWTKRPDAVIHFAMVGDGGGGTNLTWTLHVDEPVPEADLIGHMRKRLNQLINGNLRSTFGQ